MSKNKNFEPRAIKDFNSNYHFTIPDYQRGYKWTSQQVAELLNDIHAFQNTEQKPSEFYCLQPLAVVKNKKPDNSHKYEVVDGQQRLTTLYMILNYLEYDHSYHLAYKTRTESEEFLENIRATLTPILKQEIEKSKDFWEAYKETANAKNNIDIYHFVIAYYTIHQWFEKHNANFDKHVFKEKLLENVKFIWYEDQFSKEAKTLFRNLNSGKIPLTSAELIKAEILLSKLTDTDSTEINTLQAQTLAREWDNIEKELHNDHFWYFLNNTQETQNYHTRIDFLFECVVLPNMDKTEKEALNKSKLGVYHKITSTYNQEKYNDLWNDVKKLFYQFHEWYSDKDLYHLIGYILDRKFTTIADLLALRKKQPKSVFTLELKNLIKNKLACYLTENKEDNITIERITFTDNYGLIKNLLILFNLEIYRTSPEGYYFPFERFKKLKWSLEHMQPQTPRTDDENCIDTKIQWILDMTEDKTETLKIDEQKITLDSESLKGINHNLLDKVIAQLKDRVDHTIGNMALLDGSTNSSLGNQLYTYKRKSLIEKSNTIDPDHFIPTGTLRAFQKYYASTEDIHFKYWSISDRKDYLSAIKNTLQDFLITV